MRSLLKPFITSVLLGMVGAGSSAALASKDEVEITLIHTGDYHGHLIPRPNLRSDGDGRLEGGLARIFSKIQSIRKDADHSLLLHTGDTVQGSAEALYTRGQALVDVINAFGIDGFAPGNWEFVYGTDRFIELFAAADPVAPWGTVAANVRYAPPAGQPCSAGDYVLPPYAIKHVGGIKIALLGFTTDRGPQVVGSAVTAGLCFLSSVPGSSGTPDVSEVEAELRAQLQVLHDVENVDLVVMLSELGLANNSLLAERNAGINVILSSDMHEETPEAVVVTTPDGGYTIVVEEGQDGTVIGELELEFKHKKLVEWEWKSHTINERIREDTRIAALVAEVRKPFVSGPYFVEHINPFNGAVLGTPIDTVIGYTQVGLHRSNFTHEDLPGVIEGTSHDFLTDAYRGVAQTDIGAIRGFRYGTHVAPGPVKLEDIYHYMPIGAQIARGDIKGQSLKNQIENPANGSLNPDPRRWGGGWLFGFSGVSFDFDPYQDRGFRASNEKVGGVALDLTATYTYASYWFDTDPALINRVPAMNIEIAVRGGNGKALFVPIADRFDYPAMDGTEVVAQYLGDNLGGTLGSLLTHRVNLLKALPPPVFGNYEVQPLRGARP